MLEGDDETFGIVAMHDFEHRLLVLGDTGAWELWDTQTSDRLLSGKSKPVSTEMVSMSNSAFAIIGDTLIDIEAASQVDLGLNGVYLDIDEAAGLVLKRQGPDLIVDDNL